MNARPPGGNQIEKRDTYPRCRLKQRFFHSDAQNQVCTRYRIVRNPSLERVVYEMWTVRVVNHPRPEHRQRIEPRATRTLNNRNVQIARSLGDRIPGSKPRVIEDR